MATDPGQLTIYNGALSVLGQTKLATLTDDTPRRYHLDNVWDRNFRERCLAKAPWNFATRTSKLTPDPSIDPSFGYEEVYAVPSDFILLAALSINEFFMPPLTGDAYRFENDYFYCDYTEIYIRYVSDDASYGLDYSRWTEHFTEWVEAHLALRVEPLIAHGKMQEHAKAIEKSTFDEAVSQDAQERGSKSLPAGSWVAARGRRQGALSRKGDIS